MFDNNTGLLWFDDAPHTTLKEKVRHLIRHYKHKFGTTPELCYIHTPTLDDTKKVQRVDQVEIRTGRSVLPHHFWIGQRAKGDK